MVDFDVIVIGAGAAGMMCAATAGRRGRRVLLIEHAALIGEKIRISGGGRCNFTNLHCTAANFLSTNPDFCRSALVRYTPIDFLQMVDRHGIAWHEKKLGQLFCDGPSQQIIAMLKRECEASEVQWSVPTEVTSIARNDLPAGLSRRYSVATSDGDFGAQSLVIATGGLTVPKIGATPFGYQVAQQFGIAVVSPRPALVPLSLEPGLLQRLGDLAGVSVDAEVSCNGGRFRENVLFTHRGLSGPAILQISSYWDGSSEIDIDLLPGGDAESVLASAEDRRALPAAVLSAPHSSMPDSQPDSHLDSQNSQLNSQRGNASTGWLPRRFAQRWCEMNGFTKPLNALSPVKVRELARTLSSWKVKPSGTLGYNKAEVTLGGVDTRALSSKSMEANAVPGLYFAGEVMDVTGHLGGFNFQWAWASGHAAGMAA